MKTQKTHVISWRSKLTGYADRGTTAFELDDAQRICEKLNRDFEDLFHEPQIIFPLTPANLPDKSHT